MGRVRALAGVATRRAALVACAVALGACAFETSPIVPNPGDFVPDDRPPQGGSGNPPPQSMDAQVPDEASVAPEPDASDAMPDAAAPLDADVGMDAAPMDAAVEDGAAPDAEAPDASDTGAPDADDGVDEDASVCEPRPCVCPQFAPLSGTIDGCEQPVCTDSSCKPDSDCTLVYDRTSAYYFCDDQRTWEQAAARCDAVQMKLASVQDKAEDDLIASRVSDKTWLGGSDGQGPSEGVWRWPDGTVFYRVTMGPTGPGPMGGNNNGGEAIGYVNWHETEPNNDGLSEDSPADCMIFWSENLVWADASCDDPHGYVCEVERE